MQPIAVNEANQWRLATPSPKGWERSPRAHAPNKYFMISADSHLAPPMNIYKERIESCFIDRLPSIMVKDGVQYQVVDGARPAPILRTELFGEDKYRQDIGKGAPTEAEVEAQLQQRMEDLDLDGIDAELLFPNGPALTAFWTPDPAFAQAQFRIYNDWAVAATRPFKDRMTVAACVSTEDVESAIVEINRVAKLGYRVLTLPSKPVPGPADVSQVNYNHAHFDPMWAAIQDADLAITFHVSTGRDPRTARGAGGALINFSVNGIPTAMEPIATLCTSGVLARFPSLRFASVECGVGWLPWFLDTMDEGYRKHHHWVRPKLEALPSEYFRAHGAVTFGEDHAGMALLEQYHLGDNAMWANDYPHHEGTWPHSAEAIEREMDVLSEETRRKVLGLNAAKMFGFTIPEGYRQLGAQ